MYDYKEAMRESIREYIRSEVNFSEYADRYELEEALNDKLWIEDSVTGNASGSYTFSRIEAEQNVKDNLKLCIDACEEFGISSEEFGIRVYREDWEYLDVTIRCYLLGEVIAEVVNGIEM